MNFAGKGLPLDEPGINRILEDLRIDRATLWAVLSVETQGFGFLPDRRPQILFERHVFYRMTDGEFAVSYPDLCNPAAGGYAGGAGEYARLERAMALNREAALKSTSWGIAQIMGFNHAAAGLATVDELVAAMVEGENLQLQAMAGFIKNGHLDKALQARDWRSFACGYNGSGYEKNQYHTRLELAHASAAVKAPDLVLRTAQVALLYLGYGPGPIDGLRGRLTASAITQFKVTNGLPADGELDATTIATLNRTAFPAL